MLSPNSKTTVEQKIKARNCALLLKNGSPKLKTLLRERCRLRMKESRENAFSSSRNITIERKQLITTIVNEELAQQIDDDIELHDIILKEILNNWDEWQNEEFERSMDYMMNADDENQVFCPICECNLLTLQENIISCCCGLRLYYPKTLPEFYDKIQASMNVHDQQNCFAKLQFYTEPKFGFNVLALNAICTVCDYYSPILELI
ncbi:CLUMA_CG006470, isoform A [Clunio marinus]|uniref:CLUMA_CG006470, isoform A n=1 Tax=Clunio marinus TaxID=568069 RepID=A0A1J1I0F1_9DIPT|nr:CLUMA_CG006470, isoform A [Clunio marinus]